MFTLRSAKDEDLQSGRNGSSTEVTTTTTVHSSTSQHAVPHNRKSLIRVVKRRYTRRPWTVGEEEALYRAVMRHGRGSWAVIVDEGEIPGRTNVDLKDKWRWLETNGHLKNLKKKFGDLQGK